MTPVYRRADGRPNTGLQPPAAAAPMSLRIPGQADHRSGLMAITIPG
ncbi:MAG: hypothetical protein IPM24_12715 [Bryobacterales bacterium]|nr:hypothetical protein [Bryobacterales bacterium]